MQFSSEIIQSINQSCGKTAIYRSIALINVNNKNQNVGEKYDSEMAFGVSWAGLSISEDADQLGSTFMHNSLQYTKRNIQ